MSDRALIFGGSGMLGHKVCQVLSERMDTFVTLRESELAERFPKAFKNANIIDAVHVQDLDSITRAFAAARPTVVINCIGIVKQLSTSKDAVISIGVNSLFPHRLAEMCRATGSRLITVSTDCVFSGKKGNYTEEDLPDCEDLYGRSKLLGEVSAENCLTMRTSIIGRQIVGSHALVEWFLSQQGGAVRGYKNASFSGHTTLALADIMHQVITKHRDISGLYQVAADPISKYDLLTLMRDIYGLSVKIDPDEKVHCNRVLNGEKFRKATGIRAPQWKDMIRSMLDDSVGYPSHAQEAIVAGA